MPVKVTIGKTVGIFVVTLDIIVNNNNYNLTYSE
jgi:hypothetical protein